MRLGKVQILCEGHKIWKISPHEITKIVASKQRRWFFEIFMAFSEYLNFMRLFLIQNKIVSSYFSKEGKPKTQATKPLCYDLVVMTTNHIVEQFLHFKLLCKHLQIRSVPARNYEMISIHCTIIFRSIPFFSYCAMFFFLINILWLIQLVYPKSLYRSRAGRYLQ